jgi:phage shock protein PspC (stress-responsive transcriptional regulator)
MKKVININFQGRVVPIEESAYDILKQYVESLRRFFANEEGKDEIINDIEGRIAELFMETLKKGSSCITDEDVDNIIASMGRPEEFEAEEASVKSQLGGTGSNTGYQSTASAESTSRGRLYRDESDKLLGGVCGGLANYLRIDSSIMRILFAVITFGGFGMGFLLYLILWIILPSKPLEGSLVKKRLFRNPDSRVIAGVAGGLAAYFNIAVWIPRLIFALPLAIGIVVSIFTNIFGDFDPAPSVVFGSFGTTLFIIYAILWAVIPEASSASEKLEMRGEKVDLNTIKNTIQEDLSGFKGRAEKFGQEVGARAKEFGKEVGQTVSQHTSRISSEVGGAAKRSGSRLGHAIGVLFKAFFLFLAGIVAFVLLMTMLGLMIGGVSVFPLKDFFLEGFWQNFLAWTTLLLFLGVPVIALITWIIRRIMGARTKNKYIGYTLGGLWTIGLIAGICLAVSIANNFKARARVAQDFAVTQPGNGKLTVKVADTKVKVYGRWFRMDGVLNMTDDSLFLNNVRLRIKKSADSVYHITSTNYSNGSQEDVALRNAQAISYGVTQVDSLVWLDRGFALQRGTKFRNQGVVVTIEVPIGRRIVIDRSVARKLNWFRIDNGHEYDWEDEWDEYEDWSSNVEYIMTPGGLERVNKKKEAQEDVDAPGTKTKEEIKKEIEDQQIELDKKKKELQQVDSTYKYKPTAAKDDAEADANDTKPQAKTNTKPAVPFIIGDIMMMRFGS